MECAIIISHVNKQSHLDRSCWFGSIWSFVVFQHPL